MQQQILITVSLEDLEQLIKNSLLDVLKTNLVLQKESNTIDGYLTRQQASKKLHLSLTTLDTYTKKGIINAVKIGHRILYKESDIDDSLLSKIDSIKYKIN